MLALSPKSPPTFSVCNKVCFAVKTIPRGVNKNLPTLCAAAKLLSICVAIPPRTKPAVGNASVGLILSPHWSPTSLITNGSVNPLLERLAPNSPLPFACA